KQLSASGKLTAIKPLANRDGCVNTIASLLGELQRAGKTVEEFAQAIEEREQDALEVQSPKSKVQSEDSKSKTPNSKFQSSTPQIDFDREVALIYQEYSAVLNRNGLTDQDADQLRALQIIRGDVAQVANLRL